MPLMSFLVLSLVSGLVALCGLLAVIKRGYLQNIKSSAFKWNDQVILVTGGAQGIGRAIVDACSLLGCKKIIVVDIQMPNEKLPKNAEFMQCDISDPLAGKTLQEQIAKLKIDPPSILINNAGIWNRGKRILELSSENIEKVMQVNLLAPFRLIQTFLPNMLENKFGRIVNVSSVLGIGGISKMTDYCASKFGLFGMNEALRVELKTDGYDNVKTCIVCPFHVQTPLFANKVQWKHTWLMDTQTPQHVAKKIVEAIERGTEEVWLPPIVSIMPLFRFLPAWLYDAVHRLLGSNDSIIPDN